MFRTRRSVIRPRGLALAVCLAASFLGSASGQSIRVHYHRPDNTYTGWTVYAWGDVPSPNQWTAGPAPSGLDSFGAFYDIPVITNAQNVGLIIHNGNTKDPGPNQFVDPSLQGNQFWAISGIAAFYTTLPNLSQNGQLEPGYARIHYFRPDGNYTNWTVYSWNDTEEPNDYNDGPVPVTGTDSYGAYFDIKLKPNPSDIGFIVHNIATNTKDPGPDMHLNVAQFNQAWVISGDPTVYTSVPTPAQILAAGFSRLQAYWIDRNTVAIQSQYFNSAWTYSLSYSMSAGLQINANDTLGGASNIALTPAAGLTPAQLQQFPQLSGYAVFRIANTPVTTLTQVLKSQIAVAATDRNGNLKYITGVQNAGVLDDLLYYSGPLGADYSGGGITVRLWAPTAQSVTLQLFEDSSATSPTRTLAMTESAGVWSANIDSIYKDHWYLYDVRVYVPSIHQIVDNIVTDPYSLDVALNGVKSWFTDLDDGRNKPGNWDASGSPALASKEDMSVYELHVRDFSIADESVQPDFRGTYLAFTDPTTDGMRHLAKLAGAGLKAVHLLPTFHFASVNENKSTWQSPGDLSGYPPDSTEQQAKVAAVQSSDGYNWGYDPVHYMTPEGSYAVNPTNRVSEYRRMVLGLHNAGLRVIQDVVFNHTNASGQSPNSVLDEIVPAYYYRLDANGQVENASCCADTASEHKMMEKLMIDTVVLNAREYKIDGFRFDIMNFHFVYNMQHISKALAQLTLEKDGVDGSKIYLYGEGWNFGDTANDQLGPAARQANMYGTGIGTFNDRIRDAVRGGGPFDDQRVQGFSTGLFTDPSLYTTQNQTPTDQKTELLQRTDWIRAGLAGNLRDYEFQTYTGQIEKASQIDYFGQGTGYTASPIEVINYCSVHDNQTLFDAVQLKSAIPGSVSNGGDDIQTRTRRQVLAMSVIALGQGVPFFLAGDDILRSKDMDDNSYDSGDWFNKIDWTYHSANWGIGLPIASQNQSNWPIMQPLLEIPSLTPTQKNINDSRQSFMELLRIRESSRLFRMSTLQEIQSNLHFLNTGPNQVPGLIVMKLDANGGSYGPYTHIVVVFNATLGSIQFQDASLKGIGLSLHPEQMDSRDKTVRGATADNASGTLSVPGLTTAVFVSQE